MNDFIQKVTGLGAMTDQIVATDMLISSKTAMKNIAFAITETVTPEVRTVLTQQLQQSIQLHNQLSDYMIEKGYYHPYDLNEQVKVDFVAAQTALSLTNQGQQIQQ
ncbi:spore coat protein [Halalkalibacter akibai]|uniref:Spore coat protein n=1 Tax=Halalkalibacter akibai (strain ATCC 43226 / DSM 21942 / CIP 109018 / JCM 9157 / 1139) TaxID=1236973 RepID=W4QST0_HALA3|nr:spore coat protein [Halalkalibacter akibai]GAE35156.1 spore coat protein [Halalkalibacter akibai JCM 9157]